MSCFKNPQFAKELAYRTMVNYYNMRDMSVDTEKPRSYELQNVLNKMRDHNFDVSQHYEVTLALNSMIGLLIIPQQEYFPVMKKSELKKSIYELPILCECVSDNSFINTYNEEEKAPENILRHMRNSLGHNRIMIYPESANNKDITHVYFNDAFKDKTTGYSYKFKLKVPVKKLEDLMMEIANYLIGFEV